MNNLVALLTLKRYSLELKKSFLEFGLETEDNVESIRHIEFGNIGNNFGIKIKDKDVFISDIINAVEDIEDIPEEVKEYYPDLTDEEWQASTRLSTLILVLFEKLLTEQFLKKFRMQGELINEEPILNNISNDSLSLDLWSNKI